MIGKIAASHRDKIWQEGALNIPHNGQSRDTVWILPCFGVVRGVNAHWFLDDRDTATIGGSQAIDFHAFSFEVFS